MNFVNILQFGGGKEKKLYLLHTAESILRS